MAGGLGGKIATEESPSEPTDFATISTNRGHAMVQTWQFRDIRCFFVLLLKKTPITMFLT